MATHLALGDGRQLWLKWHELRRQGSDPAHDRGNLRLGIAQGASLEVVIVATRDGHFVCLHDEELSVDTTGEGPVHDWARSDLERLRQRVRLVLAGLDAGVDLVAMAKARGALVDCWRLEPEDEDAEANLLRLIEAGIDQLTTNAPQPWAARWRERAP